MKALFDRLWLSIATGSLSLCMLSGCQWINLQTSAGDWGESRSFMHAGDVAMKSGQYVAALEQFNEAAELTPDDPVVFERMSEANWELGIHTRAINQMAKAVEASDHDPRLLYRLAVLNYEYGEWLRAREALDYAIDRDPQFIDARILRADINYQQGVPSDALEDLHFVLSNMEAGDIQRQVELQLKVAGIYVYQHRFQNALSVITTVPVTKVDNVQVVQVYLMHATVLQQLGRLEDAREKLELALKLDGDHTEIYYRLAEIHTAANNMSGAALALEQALALSPNHQGVIQLINRISAQR